MHDMQNMSSIRVTYPKNIRCIKELKAYISDISSWVLYALVDDIVDAFGPLIQGIEDEVDGIDG
ncbi:CorA metal ion transporter [Ceratobasidium sp. 395]|nr:CorA metal ion transporter [Ceratobasidium sp. 395]